VSFCFSRFTVGLVHVTTFPGVRHVFRVVGVFPAQRTGHGRTQVAVRRIVFGQFFVRRHSIAGPQREHDRVQHDSGETKTVPRRAHPAAVRGVPQSFRSAVVAQEAHAHPHRYVCRNRCVSSCDLFNPNTATIVFSSDVCYFEKLYYGSHFPVLAFQNDCISGC